MGQIGQLVFSNYCPKERNIMKYFLNVNYKKYKEFYIKLVNQSLKDFGVDNKEITEHLNSYKFIKNCRTAYIEYCEDTRDLHNLSTGFKKQ